MEYKTKYLNGMYTPIQYLKCTSSTIGIENKRVLSTPEGESQEEIDSSSDEFESDSRCYVCPSKERKNFTFACRLWRKMLFLLKPLICYYWFAFLDKIIFSIINNHTQ